eukprot:TRINITY_DN1248_c1_g3_i1.p1 TRINITY_DN1248_c1_g3~~TRINITY_DN1248_c1_g3_i1.p1  ORF type:complete len:431 (+),score=52.71 TRINITY_DN1248_c1_g3_i1:99-1295(+)
MKLSEWDAFKFATDRKKDFEEACERCVGGVVRTDIRNLTVEDFMELEKSGSIVIIRGIPEAENWNTDLYTFETIFNKYGQHSFKVGKDDDGHALRLTLKEYQQYSLNQTDDSPLYVFDSVFGNKHTRQDLLSGYKPPSLFPDDYFSVLGEDRPPYKWFLMGPTRSGTSCHIDPLDTSAWNTLLKGRKKWAFIEPSVPRRVAKGRSVMKPGEDDEAINFFVDLIPRLRAEGISVTEIIQEEGETIFVPGGWWHCVLNITDTIAVTQNYCGRNNFDSVWRSSRYERPCLSTKWLRVMHPELRKRALALNAMDNFDMDRLLIHNNERRIRRRARRKARAISAAKRKASRKGLPFSQHEWEQNYNPTLSESTVSTSSSSSCSSDSDSDTSSSCSSSTSFRSR